MPPELQKYIQDFIRPTNTCYLCKNKMYKICKKKICKKCEIKYNYMCFTNMMYCIYIILLVYLTLNTTH